MTTPTPSRHLVRTAAEAARAAPPGAAGFTEWEVVGEESGAAHTGFALCGLEPGGTVPARVQSFEESVYLLAGAVVLQLPEGAVLLGEGDYGLIPPGVPHAWRNEAGAAARWARMRAPQPRSRHGGDSQPVPPLRADPPVPVDVRDPRTRLFGHVAPENMDPAKQSQDLLAVSASMRTALLVYSGISVKMMVDSDLGAVLSTMFMVQYEPDGVAGPHDHPFEETYLILEGATEGTFDGARYLLGPGDVAWAGVGCVHSFRNAGDGPVRWLETQAPQPPARHSYRFARDWEYLRAREENG
ncbi:MAG: cupin domain-containing protein [Mycobacteriales bacterium]